jgi:HEAT repeat protein
MYVRTIGLLTIVAVALCAPLAHGDEVTGLIQGLSGGDEHARVVARQLLPRHGVAALDRLLPLLGHESAAVNTAALRVVEDIVNEAGALGHEADRLQATASLMTLVAPDQPEAIRLKGLRLLPYAVPEGYDVGPVAAMLDEPELREKARATLQHIGTHEACMALVDALEKTIYAEDFPFSCALLEAIGHCQGPASVAHLRGMACHEAPEVRAAAARALAWTGDPALVSIYRRVVAGATPETEVDATTALVLYAESLAQHGGNWDLAMGLYRDVLRTSSHGILKSAALMGLGRFGDETVVADIIAGAKDGDPRLQATVVPALGALQGPAAAKAIRDAYPEFPPEAQLPLLAMLGRRGDAVFMPVLQAEAKHSDPEFRMAALHALASSGQMDAMPILVEAAQSGSEEERALALAGASRVAGSLGSAGDTAEAGKAFLSLYGLAKNDELRVKALEGIARFPVAEALDVVMAARQQEGLKAAADQALPALFGPLAAAKQNDKALEVFRAAQGANPSPETLLAMASQLQGIATDLNTAELLGVIKFWHVIGPFDWETEEDWGRAFVDEPNIDLAKTYQAGKQEVGWKPYESGSAIGLVDLMGAVAQQDRCFAYAYTEIEVAEATPAQVRVGSDDGNAVWVNGEKVWENRVDRGAAMDQDKVDCTLKQGLNRIIVKISQGAGGWNFCARLTKPDGTAVPFKIAHPEKAQ